MVERGGWDTNPKPKNQGGRFEKDYTTKRQTIGIGSRDAGNQDK